MKRLTTIAKGVLLAGAAAAAGVIAAPLSAATPEKASAALMDAAGKKVGEVMITQQPDGLWVKASVKGSPGMHGFHIHSVGKCDAPDFKSAEGHWNPTAHHHGKDNPEGAHMGDLLNLNIGANGQGTLDEKVPGAMLTKGDHPLLDADGAAMVLHSGPDDYKSDPSGNSGSRIACGVITAVK